MPSTPRSLVLGFAAGMPASSLYPFAKSLRGTTYQGKFGLITAKCSPADREASAALADIHWDVDDAIPRRPVPEWQLALLHGMRRQRGLRRAYPTAFKLAARLGPERSSRQRWSTLEFELEGLQSLRYGLYYEFIQRFAADADQVLISDLRDVVFQGDPFATTMETLELYLEGGNSRLTEESFTGRWVAALDGRATQRRLSTEVVSCSGTTAGDLVGMRHYLKEMSEAIVWRRRPMGAHDQGVHNLLLREGRFPDAKVIANGSGRVLTMGLESTVRRDAAGWILNDDGSVPPVVHQYDRHPDLQLELHARYG